MVAKLRRSFVILCSPKTSSGLQPASRACRPGPAAVNAGTLGQSRDYLAVAFRRAQTARMLAASLAFAAGLILRRDLDTVGDNRVCRDAQRLFIARDIFSFASGLIARFRSGGNARPLSVVAF